MLILTLKTEMKGNIRERSVKGPDTSQVGFACHLSCLPRPSEAFQGILDTCK